MERQSHPSALMRLAYLIGMALLLATLTGCGGSGSSSGADPEPPPSGPPQQPTPDPEPDPDPDPPAATGLQGQVKAPSGSIGHVPERTPLQFAHYWLQQVSELFAPVAAAAMDGLVPVAGGTVELIRVDNAGNPVGDVLASATISGTGHYALTLPDDTSLSGSLVLRVTLAEDVQMRAVAAQEEVDIDPISEFIVRELTAAELDLDRLAVNEIVRLRGQIEGFSMASGDSLDDALANLASSTGALVAQEIAEIGAGPADDALRDRIAGDYRVAGLAIGLRNNASGGVDDHEIWIHGAGDARAVTLAPAQAEGRMTLDAGALETVAGGAFFPGGGGANARLLIEIENDEAATLDARVGASGVVALDIPFEEVVLDDQLGIRKPAGVLRLEPVGHGESPYGLVGFFTDPERLFGVTADGALDPANPVGRGEALELIVGVSNAQPAPTLQDRYGFVELAQVLEYGDCVETIHTLIEFARLPAEEGDENWFAVDVEGDRISVGTCEPVDDESGQFEIQMHGAPGGRFEAILDEEVVLAGYADAGANLMLAPVLERDEEGDPAGYVQIGLMVGLALPETAPDLVGTEWSWYSLHSGYAHDWDVLDEVSSFTGTRVTFEADGATLAPSREIIVERGGEHGVRTNAEFTEEVSMSGVHVVQSGGRIAIDAGETQLEGFVSADGQLMVLRDLSQFEGNASRAGLVIGIRRE